MFPEAAHLEVAHPEVIDEPFPNNYDSVWFRLFFQDLNRNKVRLYH